MVSHAALRRVLPRALLSSSQLGMTTQQQQHGRGRAAAGAGAGAGRGGGGGGGGVRAFLSVVANMTTAVREFGALVAVPRSPLLGALLGGLASQNHNAQATARGARGAAATSASAICARLGHMGAGYVSWLQKSFNPSQLGAIEAAATQGRDRDRDRGGRGGRGGRVGPAAAAAPPGGGFTLVQGPPGTGKTTTLKGLLNTLHQRDYNAYYQSLLARALSPDGGGLPGLGRGGGGSRGALGDGTVRGKDGVRRRGKPHILVAAPSNVAVDGIVERVMREGFVDARGKVHLYSRAAD